MQQTPGRPDLRKSVIVRDFIIFQIKLWLDGVKDFVLSPLAFVAGLLDLLRGPGKKGYRMYRVMRRGERFDLWLNLYGPASQAEKSGEGFFGASEADDGTLIGEFEALDERRRARRAREQREPR